MKSNLDKVTEFHDKFNLPLGRVGHIISDERAMLRTRLMMEELAELVEAMQRKQYVDIAQELADLLYVTYGTAVEYGIPVDVIVSEIHRANMTKDNTYTDAGKIPKGPDFKKADVQGVLTKAILERNDDDNNVD